MKQSAISKDVWPFQTCQVQLKFQNFKINVENFEKQSKPFPLRKQIIQICVRPKVKINSFNSIPMQKLLIYWLIFTQKRNVLEVFAQRFCWIIDKELIFFCFVC